MRWVPYTCPPGAGAPSNLHPGSLAGLSSSRPYSVICLDLSFRKSLLAALARKAGWGRGWGGRGKPLRWLWLSLEFKTSKNFCYGACWQEAFTHIPIGFSACNSPVSLFNTWRNWGPFTGLLTGERHSKELRVVQPKADAFPGCAHPDSSPELPATWKLGLHPITSTSSMVPVKGDDQKSLLLQIGFPSFFLWGMICLLHWLDGLETA